MNVTSAMRELSIDKDSFRVLGLLPLVYVAWADGTIQRAERARIRKVAKSKGWLTGGGEAILDGWLETAPSDDYARLGMRVLRELAQKKRGVGAALDADNLTELLQLCRDVADAAGGHWGIGEAISGEEADALGAVAEALGLGNATTWEHLVTEADAVEENRAPGPRGHLLVGDVPELLADPLGSVSRWVHEYGDVIRLRVPGAQVFLLTRPEHIQHVLVDNNRNYFRGRSFDAFRPLIGESILTTSGEPWRRFRRLAQPAFHHKAVAQMASMMADYTQELADGWDMLADTGGEFDVAAEMHQLTLRIIGHALFGLDLDGEANREFSDAVSIAIEGASDRLNPIRIPDVIPTPKNVRFKRAAKYFDETIAGFIAERRSAGDPGTDLLGMLLAARDEETGEGLSDEHVRNEMLTYLVAGHETTATTLTWLFYLLSKHPVVGRRLDAELASVLEGRAPGADDIPELPYLTMVLNETMRLYPAAFLTSREAVAEDRVGGYTIGRGDWVMVSAYATHRRPDLWPNPEGFDPERFSEKNSAQRHPCAFLPFLVGPHKCIGQALSLLEMHIVTAVLRQRYRLDLVPDCEPQRDAKVTLRAAPGVQMSAHRH